VGRGANRATARNPLSSYQAALRPITAPTVTRPHHLIHCKQITCGYLKTSTDPIRKSHPLCTRAIRQVIDGTFE